MRSTREQGAGRNIAVVTFNVVPPGDAMLKYERLGALALENRRLYCRRHGYTFIHEVPVAPDRPACWAKIPALLTALEDHEWVLWADSDALILEPWRPLEAFCEARYDLVVQDLTRYFETLGLDPQEGRRAMPINTGVFLVRATDWSRRLLRRAYEQEHLISRGEVWDGIGDQEALVAVLGSRPEDLARVGYLDGLQSGPRFYRAGYLFAHFYGHYARHHIPAEACEEVFARWEAANAAGGPFPDDVIRFHWCCIQNKDPEASRVNGDLHRYLYAPEDIAG